MSHEHVSGARLPKTGIDRQGIFACLDKMRRCTKVIQSKGSTPAVRPGSILSDTPCNPSVCYITLIAIYVENTTCKEPSAIHYLILHSPYSVVYRFLLLLLLLQRFLRIFFLIIIIITTHPSQPRAAALFATTSIISPHLLYLTYIYIYKIKKSKQATVIHKRRGEET